MHSWLHHPHSFFIIFCIHPILTWTLGFTIHFYTFLLAHLYIFYFISILIYINYFFVNQLKNDSLLSTYNSINLKVINFNVLANNSLIFCIFSSIDPEFRRQNIWTRANILIFFHREVPRLGFVEWSAFATCKICQIILSNWIHSKIHIISCWARRLFYKKHYYHTFSLLLKDLLELSGFITVDFMLYSLLLFDTKIPLHCANDKLSFRC